jgi:endonuclease G
MKNYACSVDSVEKVTGIDFFYRLPNDVESRVEAQVNLPVWGFK